MILVLDASVAAKWLFEEADTAKARELLLRTREGQLRLRAPEILPVEIASSLYKRVLRGSLGEEEATAHYARFARLCPALVPIFELAEAALKLALTTRHSVYDSLYVALAIRMRCGLITADEKLHQRFSQVYPRVLRLRDWS